MSDFDYLLTEVDRLRARVSALEKRGDLSWSMFFTVLTVLFAIWLLSGETEGLEQYLGVECGRIEGEWRCEER
jgi:hypothetical protein